MRSNLNNLRNDISITVKHLLKYYDIGFVFNHLESLLTLHVPFKNAKHSEEEYQNNKNIAFKTIETAEKNYQEILKEFTLRKEIFEEAQKNNPNFCKNMRDKIGKDEYEEYLKSIRKFSHEISSVLLYVNEKKANPNSAEYLLHNKDNISAIIDSEQSSKVSYIEDSFVLSELETLDLSTFDEKTLENIDTLKDSLKQRIKDYDFFNKLYKKGNKIRLKAKEREH